MQSYHNNQKQDEKEVDSIYINTYIPIYIKYSVDRTSPPFLSNAVIVIGGQLASRLVC